MQEAFEECVAAMSLKGEKARLTALAPAIVRLHESLEGSDPRTAASGYGMLHSCLSIQEALGDKPMFDGVFLLREACSSLPREHTQQLRIQLAGDHRLNELEVVDTLSELTIAQLTRYEIDLLLALLESLSARFGADRDWTFWREQAQARRKELKPARRR